MRDVISRPIQALWGNKFPKIDAITAVQSLVEQFSDAALVFEENQNRILYANSAFLVLSAFSNTEVINTSIEDIFDGINSENLKSNEPFMAMLKLRNRPLLPVIVRTAPSNPIITGGLCV